MKIALAQIRRDGGTQSRADLDHGAVEAYGDAMLAGATFPPVVVFYDGTVYWLADGFHRCEAADAAGREEIDAEVWQGTRRDAVLYSVGANVRHGVRITNADKNRAVQMLLEDEEWSAWTDRKIADVCGVSHTMVANARRRNDAPRGNGCHASSSSVATVATPSSVATVATPSNVHPVAAAPDDELVALAHAQEVFERGVALIVDASRTRRGAELLRSTIEQQLPRLQRLLRGAA